MMLKLQIIISQKISVKKNFVSDSVGASGHFLKGLFFFLFSLPFQIYCVPISG